MPASRSSAGGRAHASGADQLLQRAAPPTPSAPRALCAAPPRQCKARLPPPPPPPRWPCCMRPPSSGVGNAAQSESGLIDVEGSIDCAANTCCRSCPAHLYTTHVSDHHLSAPGLQPTHVPLPRCYHWAHAVMQHGRHQAQENVGKCRRRRAQHIIKAGHAAPRQGGLQRCTCVGANIPGSVLVPRTQGQCKCRNPTGCAAAGAPAAGRRCRPSQPARGFPTASPPRLPHTRLLSAPWRGWCRRRPPQAATRCSTVVCGRARAWELLPHDLSAASHCAMARLVPPPSTTSSDPVQ